MPIYPRDFLEAFPHDRRRSNCFVLMPFAPAFDDVYASIRDACESPQLLLSCSRADDFYGAGHIMEDILTGILASDYLVADVTGKNPNVFYELGIAHCCKAPSKVIIISQTLEDVPFDLRHMRVVTYRNDPAGLRKLRLDLERALLSDAGAEYRFVAEEAHAFEFRERLSGRNRNFYRFTLEQLHVGRTAVKCALIVHRESLDEGNATMKPDYHYLEVGNTAPIRHTDWQLRLDRTDQARAYFTVCRVEPYEILGRDSHVASLSKEGGETKSISTAPYQIHHVSVAVSKLEEAKDFYENTLGLSPIHRPQFDFEGIVFDGAWYELPNGQQVHLVEYPEGAPEDSKNLDFRNNHFGLRVSNIKKTEDHLRNSGVKQVRHSASMRRRPQLYISDPDGNIIEINEKWTADPSEEPGPPQKKRPTPRSSGRLPQKSRSRRGD